MDLALLDSCSLSSGAERHAADAGRCYWLRRNRSDWRRSDANSTRAAGRAFGVFLAGEFARQRVLRIGREVLGVVLQVAPAWERHAAIPRLAPGRPDQGEPEGGNPQSLRSHVPPPRR